MPIFRVTYSTYNLNTCTLVDTYSENVECSVINEVYRSTLSRDSCDFGSASGWGSTDGVAACCDGIAPGTGSDELLDTGTAWEIDYIVQYSKINLNTCEIDHSVCEYLPRCDAVPQDTVSTCTRTQPLSGSFDVLCTAPSPGVCPEIDGFGFRASYIGIVNWADDATLYESWGSLCNFAGFENAHCWEWYGQLGTALDFFGNPFYLRWRLHVYESGTVSSGSCPYCIFCWVYGTIVPLVFPPPSPEICGACQSSNSCLYPLNFNTGSVPLTGDHTYGFTHVLDSCNMGTCFEVGGNVTVSFVEVT